MAIDGDFDADPTGHNGQLLAHDGIRDGHAIDRDVFVHGGAIFEASVLGRSERFVVLESILETAKEIQLRRQSTSLVRQGGKGPTSPTQMGEANDEGKGNFGKHLEKVETEQE